MLQFNKAAPRFQINVAQDVFKIDLTRAGFAAPRAIGDLDGTNVVPGAVQSFNEIAALTLALIDVEKKLDGRTPDLSTKVDGVVNL